jgi:hypothetical protein
MNPVVVCGIFSIAVIVTMVAVSAHGQMSTTAAGAGRGSTLPTLQRQRRLITKQTVNPATFRLNLQAGFITLRTRRAIRGYPPLRQ